MVKKAETFGIGTRISKYIERVRELRRKRQDELWKQAQWRERERTVAIERARLLKDIHARRVRKTQLEHEISQTKRTVSRDKRADVVVERELREVIHSVRKKQPYQTRRLSQLEDELREQLEKLRQRRGGRK